MDNELARRLKEINKKHIIAKLARDIHEPEKVSSGIDHLDIVLGGGFPLGRVVVLYGRYGSTKSTIALWAIADAQRQGKRCIYIDAEKSFDSSWAQTCGVDIDNLLVLTSRNLEHILDAMEALKDDSIDVIVVDSVSSIHSAQFLDEDTKAIAIQAKATKKLMAKLEYWNPDALIIVISQMTVGFSGQQAISDHTGGNALKHASTVTLMLTYSNSDVIHDKNKVRDRVVDTDVAYIDITWKVQKARSEQLGATGKFRFIPGFGNDKRFELFELALKRGVVTQRGGGYYTFNNQEWRGKETVIDALEDADLYKEMKYEVSNARPAAGEFEIEPEPDSGDEGN